MGGGYPSFPISVLLSCASVRPHNVLVPRQLSALQESLHKKVSLTTEAISDKQTDREEVPTLLDVFLVVVGDFRTHELKVCCTVQYGRLPLLVALRSLFPFLRYAAPAGVFEPGFVTFAVSVEHCVSWQKFFWLDDQGEFRPIRKNRLKDKRSARTDCGIIFVANKTSPTAARTHPCWSTVDTRNSI